MMAPISPKLLINTNSVSHELCMKEVNLFSRYVNDERKDGENKWCLASLCARVFSKLPVKFFLGRIMRYKAYIVG